MKKPIINPGIIKRLKSIFAIVQDGDVATRNIASGKYVLWKNVPCHASSAITTGDTLAIGTNLTADNDGFINALHDGLSAFSGKAIANNLTTETAGYVLDARQGKALNDSISNMDYFTLINSEPITPTLTTVNLYQGRSMDNYKYALAVVKRGAFYRASMLLPTSIIYASGSFSLTEVDSTNTQRWYEIKYVNGSTVTIQASSNVSDATIRLYGIN